MPAPARLPEYQRQFRGDKYPPPERQHEIHQQNYSYQPREPVVRDHYERQAEHDKGGNRGQDHDRGEDHHDKH
jgi:hypothetical protein